MGFYNLPYMYGLLNAAFYYWFANTNVLMYSIFPVEHAVDISQSAARIQNT